MKQLSLKKCKKGYNKAQKLTIKLHYYKKRIQDINNVEETALLIKYDTKIYIRRRKKKNVNKEKKKRTLIKKKKFALPKKNSTTFLASTISNPLLKQPIQ